MGNMKSKKILSLLLLVSMTLCLLVGCQGKDSSGNKAAGKSATETLTGKYIADTDYIKSKIGDANVILVDARGEKEAKKGTIKGAMAMMWQEIAKVADGQTGDEMWGTVLEKDALEKKLGSLGLDKNKEIILFANGKNGWGDDGRILWCLRIAGYDKVKMANCSFENLKAAGIKTTDDIAKLPECKVKIDSMDYSHDINTDELKKDYDTYKVVDVRADKEFNGEILYGEKKGGRLPKAIHIGFTDLYKEDGFLKSKDDIVKMFTDKKINKDDKIVTYCTAGIRSAHMQLILEMCGFENTKNYDESYYRWCAVNEVEK